MVKEKSVDFFLPSHWRSVEDTKLYIYFNTLFVLFCKEKNIFELSGKIVVHFVSLGALYNLK